MSQAIPHQPSILLFPQDGCVKGAPLRRTTRLFARHLHSLSGMAQRSGYLVRFPAIFASVLSVGTMDHPSQASLLVQPLCSFGFRWAAFCSVQIMRDGVMLSFCRRRLEPPKPWKERQLQQAYSQPSSPKHDSTLILPLSHPFYTTTPYCSLPLSHPCSSTLIVTPYSSL